MSNPLPIPKKLTRITCMAHHILENRVAELLAELGIHSALVENARCVRYRIRPRAMGFPGHVAKLDPSPMDVFQISATRETAGLIMKALVDTAELQTPGHGMLYAQDVVEYSMLDPSPVAPDTEHKFTGLRDMALLTCILSMPGSGDNLARIALKLGAGVPVISRGIGTGIRDRIGLLRITIPPEKEIVRLIIPAHDADGIRRIFIEEGRLNRPGGGFIYQTPIREAIVDPLLNIGRQGHAASMEQIIAALDDLKGGTSWRKRYEAIDDQRKDLDRQTKHNYSELTFTCFEGYADRLVRAAMEAGASGATTSPARVLQGDKTESESVARETGILCVPSGLSNAVINALCNAMSQCDQSGGRVQFIEAPAVFMYQRKKPDSKQTRQV